MFIILLRAIMGNFNFLTISFVPSFMASLVAILVERPSRRNLLTLYVTNVVRRKLLKENFECPFYAVKN